ncbi:MAG: hypothetical protein IT478_15110 [Xanthomonadales bacterium]|nr:hypothetical protein [Xanthomonadales bacterium]
MPRPPPQRRFIAYGLLAGSVLLLLMAVVLAQVLADAPAFLPWLLVGVGLAEGGIGAMLLIKHTEP